MVEQSSRSHDEIDLIELFRILWSKKWWIVISTIIFTTLAGVYAFAAKEQWTSKAEVVEPQLVDLGDYLDLKKKYALIIENNKVDTNQLAIDLKKDLFNKFELVASSLDKRREFFENSKFYQDLSIGKDESTKRRILSELINQNISVIRPDLKKDPDANDRKIHFFAETAIDAQDTLKQFIDFVNAAAYQQDLDNLLILLQQKINDLNLEQTILEKELQSEKIIQLANLNKALEIAKAAGIKDYSKTFADNDTLLAGIALSDTKIPLSESKLNDSTYLFMLGENYLRAQIDVVNQKDLIYPPRYYQIQDQLSQVNILMGEIKQTKAQTYSYQASPDYPVTRDKPKKALILLIGIIFGGIIGMFGVLISSLFTKNKRV